MTLRHRHSRKPAMPLTTTDLIRAVLENLSRLAAGQPVSAEDSDRVTLRMNATFESLAALDIFPSPILTTSRRGPSTTWPTASPCSARRSSAARPSAASPSHASTRRPRRRCGPSHASARRAPPPPSSSSGAAAAAPSVLRPAKAPSSCRRGEGPRTNGLLARIVQYPRRTFEYDPIVRNPVPGRARPPLQDR